MHHSITISIHLQEQKAHCSIITHSERQEWPVDGFQRETGIGQRALPSATHQGRLSNKDDLVRMKFNSLISHCDLRLPGYSKCIRVQAICQRYRDEMTQCSWIKQVWWLQQLIKLQLNRFLHLTQTIPAHFLASGKFTTDPNLEEPINSRVVSCSMFSFSHGFFLDFLRARCKYQKQNSFLRKSLEAVVLAYMANEHYHKDLRQMALVVVYIWYSENEFEEKVNLFKHNGYKAT